MNKHPTATHSPEKPKADTPKATTKPCPYCAEDIKADAKKCKHCGEYLDEEMRKEKKQAEAHLHRKWNPGVAAVLSLVIPGAGQMYKGDVGKGILWLIGVVFGYSVFIIPGLIAHIFCIASAYAGDPTK